MEESLKFVIVGHIDHGKSTLIGRLLYDTGSLPQDKIVEMRKVSEKFGKEAEFSFLLDHLEEERKRGITIDTTQTYFRAKKREYVIIDAPGHREFIRNMVTGTSKAEAGVLIIDASEGIKEQTRRHGYILSLLGISQIIVVFNKMDIVDYSEEIFEKLKMEAKRFFSEIGIEPLFYIPVSALKGENIIKKSEKMPWYKGPAFVESLDLIEKSEIPQDILVFPVQDIYTINSEKVIVGRIETGRLKVGDEIEILPDGKRTKVKSIEKFNEKKEVSFSGESIGITINPEVHIERGMVICHPDKKPPQSSYFTATLLWMDKEPLLRSEKIKMKCMTQTAQCEIVKIRKKIDTATLKPVDGDMEKLENLEVGEVELRSEKILVMESFEKIPQLGRFVLLRENICAAGLVREI